MAKWTMNDAFDGLNELTERKRRVLWAIVQDYSSTAEPVGSRTIARKYDLGVSSATIRNEMQDLEDEGYLEQPHTSAGRVPSIKGYRYYVDWLMQPSPVTPEEESLLVEALTSHVAKVDEIFRNMAKVVSMLTRSLSVAASSGQQSILNYIRFLPLDEIQLLADKLNHFLHGRDLARVDEKFIMSFQKDVERDLSPYIHIFAAMQEAVKTQKQVYSDGASQLIEQPEFQNVEKMQDILNLLEKRDILESMLLSTMDRPIAVHIGTENAFKNFEDLSVVRAQFTANGKVIGSMAVLGPTRMQYEKVVGMMYFMQHQLNQLLEKDDD